MRGEVTLRVTCLTPERLLERAMDSGARFDSVQRPDARSLIVECDAASAGKTLALCRRFSIPAVVLSTRGRSALIGFARRRPTLPVGLILCVALCALFLSRIWIVDIAFTGGESAAMSDDAGLRRALESAGIQPGILRNVDAALLEQRLRASAEGLSYVGVRLTGVRLLVEAAREVPSPALYDVDAARDLVADRDGIVVRAVARAGRLCVKPGDAVRRGQLLIRGEERAAGEETRPIAALGEIVVRAWYTGEATLPAAESRLRPTGRVSHAAALTSPWLSLPVREAESYSLQREETRCIPVGGLYFPLELCLRAVHELRRSDVRTDPAVLKNRLSALAVADAAAGLARNGPKEYEIHDRWVEYRRSGDSLRARAVYEIYTDAAVDRSALDPG